MKKVIGYDETKEMLNKLRKLNESYVHNKTKQLREDIQSSDNPSVDSGQKDNILVINDVDVKLISNDESDMDLTEEQKKTISELIDNFKQQVSQIVEFDPGLTINEDQVRLDGKLTDEDVSFVFIAGKDSGTYINSEMMKLENKIAQVLEKLVKFEETFKTSLEPIIDQRKNNI
jgi:hypothetical protein